MSKTEVSGKQVKDGSIELVDLSTALSNTISGKAEAADVTALDTRVTAVESDVAALQSASAPNLSDLGEVSITSPSSGQVLKYNGTGWANAADSTFSGDYADLSNKPTIPSALDDLSDVTISSPSNDQVLKYNGTAWVNSAAPAAGATELDGLSDVTLTSSSTNEFLKYNGSAWVNSALPEASSSVAGIVTTGAQTIAGTKTFSGQVNLDGKGIIGGATPTVEDLFVARQTYNGGAVIKVVNPSTQSAAYSAIRLGNSTSDEQGTIAILSSSNSNGANGMMIMNAGNNFIDHWTNGTRRTRIDGAGLVGINETTLSAQLNITSGAAARKGLIVKAAASQSANVVEVQNSAAANMFLIDATGGVQISDKKTGATASTLYLTTTNIYSRILNIQQPVGHASNCIQIINSAGTVLSAFGSDGQLYDDGMSVLSYRTYQTMTADGTGSTSYPGSAVYNPVVWVGGVQKTAGTHYNLAGSWIQWTAGNIPANGTTVEIHGTPNNWRNSAGDGNGFAYFPVVSIGSKKPGTSNLPMLTTEVLSAARKGIVVKAAASQTANLLEVQNSSATVLASISSGGSLNATRFVETAANAFNTSLAPSSGSLTVDSSVGNVVLGALSASVTTWAFTNVPTDNSRVTTVSAVIAGNTSYTYGSACSVNGSAVATGVQWFGGTAPTPSSTTDVLTFVIIRDSAGTIRVLGSAQTIDSVVGSASAGIDGAGSANYLSKWTDSNTIANSAIYESAGKVGIGTTSSVSGLNVVASDTFGTMANTVAVFQASKTTTSDAGVAIGVLNGNSPFIAATALNNGSGTAQSLRFRTSNSDRLIIDASGNITIGGAVTSNQPLRTHNPTSGRTYAMGPFYNNDSWHLTYSNDSFSTHTMLLSVSYQGYIGTGTAAGSPYNNTTAAAANIHCAGDGVLYRSTSSLKYKEQVENMTYGLDKVMELRPVTYKGKAEADGEKRFGGLIAEEVHDAGLSEFVQYANDGTPDALAYGNMVSLAFKAIQELNAKVDALQAEKEALEARIAALENN